MILRITQKHIDQGVRSSHYYCPYALALAEAAGGMAFVTAFMAYVCPTGSNERFVFALSPEARDHIERFDATGKMEPHTVVIPVV